MSSSIFEYLSRARCLFTRRPVRNCGFAFDFHPGRIDRDRADHRERRCLRPEWKRRQRPGVQRIERKRSRRATKGVRANPRSTLGG